MADINNPEENYIGKKVSLTVDKYNNHTYKRAFESLRGRGISSKFAHQIACLAASLDDLHVEYRSEAIIEVFGADLLHNKSNRIHFAEKQIEYEQTHRLDRVMKTIKESE